MHQAPIIFDLDGTLVDSLNDLAASLNAVLARLHCTQHPIDTIRTMIGGGARKLIERGLGPSNGHKLDEAMDLFTTEYGQRLLQSSRLYPGIDTMLETLRANGRTWSIATNKPADFTAAIIDGLDLHRMGLTSWASGDEVAQKKPAPDVLRLAIERGGFTSTPIPAITYVGDMPIDVAAGRRLGCATIGVTYGFDPEGVAQAEPDYLVSSAAELLPVLKARKDKELDKHQVGQEGGGSVQA
ncbi:MAG: HAD hydrolase-like protein [Myxococcota bacterium]